MALDTPAKHIYSGDGSTRVFPIPTEIIGDDYIRIEIDNVYQSDRASWDIVNNSIIFKEAPPATAVDNITVQVATSEEALGQLGNVTSIDLVAGSIEDINAIATDIIPNLPEILLADDNAATATQKAQEASDNADQTALDRIATGEDVVSTNANVVQTGLDRVATNADATQTALDRVATGLDRVATGEDRVQTGLDRAESTTQANRAETEADRAEGYADSINPEELASISQVASSTNTNPDSISIVNDNLVFTNSYFNYTAGITDKGYTLTSRDVTKTVDSSGVSDGIKWVSENSDGTNSFFDGKPNYGLYTKTSADDNRPVFVDGKWYSASGGAIYENDGTNTSGLSVSSIGASTISIESNQIKLTNIGSVFGGMYFTSPTTIGEKYKITYSIALGTSTTSGLYIGISDNDYSISDTVQSNQVDIEFIATSSMTYFTIYNQNTSNGYNYYDNISVYAVEPTIGAEILPTPSFMQNPVYFDNGIPQFIDYSQELETNVMDSLNVKDLVVQDKFDLGQAWQNVTASRSSGVTYTNTTGKPIMVAVKQLPTSNYSWTFTVDSVIVAQVSSLTNLHNGVQAIVPPGSTYLVSALSGNVIWAELR